MKLNIFRKSPTKKDPYPEEDLNAADRWGEADDGTIPENVATLGDAVVGHRIVKAEVVNRPHRWRYTDVPTFVITLDNGKEVELANTDDCCAYTELRNFLLDPNSVDHVIMGVGTTEEASVWHIYADWGDILNLEVDWSCGNPFYYGYGFDITVQEIPSPMATESESELA